MLLTNQYNLIKFYKMSSFKEIPDVSQSANIIYAHPYPKPRYDIDEFEINFNDFPLESDAEKKLKKKQELEEKIMKIQELNMLKSLEASNIEKYEKILLQLKEDLLEEPERKGNIRNINKLIGNLENCIADLTKYFLNYQSEKQDAVFNKLNDLMYESDLELTGENENTRSELLSNEFSALKSISPKVPRNKSGK